MDKKALAKLDLSKFQNNQVNKEPLTYKEKQLAIVFSTVLDLPLDSIGKHSDFFNLGGNSISAIRLVQQCIAIDFHITTKDVFTRRTISLLIKYCSNGDVAIQLPEIEMRYL